MRVVVNSNQFKLIPESQLEHETILRWLKCQAKVREGVTTCSAYPPQWETGGHSHDIQELVVEFHGQA